MNVALTYLYGLGGFEIVLIFLIFGLIPVVLWFWSLIDCLKSDFKNYDKIVWILLIILLPIIGAILYLIIGKSQKI